MKPNFYALMPSLFDQFGHVYIYNKIVAQVVQLNGFKHIGFIPKSCLLTSLPKTWLKTLTYADQGTSSFWFKKCTEPFILNLFFFISFFKKKKRKQRSILFIEHYTFPTLASIAIGAFLTRPPITFWHVMRYSPSQQRAKGRLHFWLHLLLEKALGKEHVVLLTDTAPIAEEIQHTYGRIAHILPIPHTQEHRSSNAKNLSFPILCWWPGNPRQEKGTEEIILLSQRLEKKDLPVELILSEQMQDSLPLPNPKIRWVPRLLSREAYCEKLNEAHLILLPYQAHLYGKRSSGIFVEAVISGAIPLVSAQTWMSYELERFDLKELIVDWTSCEDQFLSFFQDEQIRKKLSVMQKTYTEFHNQTKFADIFAKIAAREF